MTLSNGNVDGPKSVLSEASSALSKPHYRRPPGPKRTNSIFKDADEFDPKRHILKQAIKKGAFVFLFSHGVLTGTKLAFALLRFIRARKTLTLDQQKLNKLIFDIISDASTARLSALLGGFALIWPIAYPGLRKSGVKRDHETGQILSERGTFVSRHAAAIAGALAGLAILAQTKKERVDIAPQLFCRGIYSLLKARPLFNLPYPDIFLFAAANAQIMPAFVLYPQTLPPWYWNWILRTGTLSREYMRLIRVATNGEMSNLTDIAELVQKQQEKASPFNFERLTDYLGKDDPTKWPTVPCWIDHPGEAWCIHGTLNKSALAFRQMLPTYVILHLVPALVFRGSAFLKAPGPFLFNIARKTTFSCLFISTFVWIITQSLCVSTNGYSHFKLRLSTPKWYAVFGALTSLSLLWEEPHRRGELGLYCAPKALASVWFVLRAKGLVPQIPWGEVLLAIMGTASLMHCYVHSPEKMPSLARGVIGQLVDPHTIEIGKSRRREADVEKANQTEKGTARS